MNKNLVSGVALVAIAGAYYVWSNQIADSTLSDEIGAGGLPHTLAIILAGLGVLLIARTLLAMRLSPETATGEADDDEDKTAGLPRAIGFLLLGAAYVALLPFVGYAIGVTLLIAAVALYEGGVKSWVIPVAAIGGGIFYWAIFVKLLGVNQPVGVLFQGLF